MKKIFLAINLLIVQVCGSQQILKPGFDAREYAELLSLAFYSSSIPDSVIRKTVEDPYRLQYRSPEVGLLNRWSLFLRKDNVASINIRGTIGQSTSWLANFYAAMIPATGNLDINDSTHFEYQLSRDPKAMVHVGWTISLAHLAPDILSKIQALYKDKHVKEFLLFGHSQGAGINFLLRAWLEFEKIKGNLPADIIFKTYCSAGPKPGNMYFSYDYDFITRNGWGFNVVNAADWVPESPFSMQTLNDLNPTNPLIHTKKVLKKQKLLIRVAGGVAYNKMTKKPNKAVKKYRRYLGNLVYKKGVKKVLTQLKEPDYAMGNNYMRAGSPVILMPDKEYMEKFPESDKSYFVHHLFAPYYFLLKKIYFVN